MRWLITVRSGANLQSLGDAVAYAHGSLREIDPVPMGEDEVVVFAEGPSDLPQRLGDTGADVLQVSPDSEPEPY
jgi:hypothetical protein